MVPRVTRHSSLRIAFVFLVCFSLAFSNIFWFKSRAQGQGESRSARPRHRKPESTLPDLYAVKHESNVDRETPPPIPSSVRAKRNEGRPWDGRRVGDPGTSQRPPDQPDEERQTRRAHTRRRVASPLS